MNICLILRPPRGNPGIGLPTPGRRPQEWSRIEIQLSGATSVRVPSTSTQPDRDADLVVAQHIVGDAVPVGAAVRPRVFQRCAETAAQLDVERDRGVLGRVEAAPGSPRAVRQLGSEWARRRCSPGPTTAGGRRAPSTARCRGTRRPRRRRRRDWCTCRRRGRSAASCRAHVRSSRSSPSTTDLIG